MITVTNHSTHRHQYTEDYCIKLHKWSVICSTSIMNLLRD